MKGVFQTTDGIRRIDHGAYQEALKELSEEQLRYIAKDAQEAARAVGRDNPNQGSYEDEVLYALMELRSRQKARIDHVVSAALDSGRRARDRGTEPRKEVTR